MSVLRQLKVEKGKPGGGIAGRVDRSALRGGGSVGGAHLIPVERSLVACGRGGGVEGRTQPISGFESEVSLGGDALE